MIEKDTFNPQLTIDALPTIEDVLFTNISRNLLWKNVINLSIFFFVLITMGVLFYLFGDGDFKEIMGYVLIGVALLYLVFVFIQIKGIRYKQYALRAKDVLYKSGWIWRRTTAVPFARIQHSEVVRSPFDQLFDIATLKIYTAGGSSSDLSISGIPEQRAEKMRAYIVRQAKLQDEEE